MRSGGKPAAIADLHLSRNCFEPQRLKDREDFALLAFLAVQSVSLSANCNDGRWL
jgi:hypothetical protein